MCSENSSIFYLIFIPNWDENKNICQGEWVEQKVSIQILLEKVEIVFAAVNTKHFNIPCQNQLRVHSILKWIFFKLCDVWKDRSGSPALLGPQSPGRTMLYLLSKKSLYFKSLIFYQKIFHQNLLKSFLSKAPFWKRFSIFSQKQALLQGLLYLLLPFESRNNRLPSSILALSVLQ